MHILLFPITSPGASSGIGRAVAAECVSRGARVVLACRDVTKTMVVMATIRRAVPAADVHFLLLDLASLDSVRACADAFMARFGHLNVLVNNAGKRLLLLLSVRV